MDNNLTKKIGIALAISVALNLFAIGYFVGHPAFGKFGRKDHKRFDGPRTEMMQRGPQGGPGQPGGFMGGMGLSPEGEKIVREKMQAAREGMKDAFKETQEKREKAISYLRQTPPDIAKAEKLFAEVRETMSADFTKMQNQFMEIFKQLSEQDRKAFLDRSESMFFVHKAKTAAPEQGCMGGQCRCMKDQAPGAHMGAPCPCAGGAVRAMPAHRMQMQGQPVQGQRRMMQKGQAQQQDAYPDERAMHQGGRQGSNR